MQKSIINKVLLVGDCVSWSIDRLVLPIATKLGIDHVYTDNSETRWKRTGYTDIVGTKKFTFEQFEAGNYDIVHHHNLRALYCMFGNGRFIDGMKGKKLILTVHTGREEEIASLGDRYKRVDMFVAPTKKCEEILKKKFGDKVVHIPHAIDDKFFKFGDYNENGKTVGYIGRICRWKHYKEIAEYSQELGYNIKACGYVEDHDYWQSCKVNKLSIYVQQNKMIDFMKQFTVYCAISDPSHEAGPLPVIECASMGIPVLATNMGWVEDNMTHGENVWITDMKHLKTDMKMLVENKELREKLRQGARKLIDNWTLENYIGSHGELYAKI